MAERAFGFKTPPSPPPRPPIRGQERDCRPSGRLVRENGALFSRYFAPGVWGRRWERLVRENGALFSRYFASGVWGRPWERLVRESGALFSRSFALGSRLWLWGPSERPRARQAERAFGLSAPPGPPPEPQNRVKSGIIGSGPSGAAGWPETRGS